jgi:peroxiredoxin Q/BCP
VRRSVSSGIHDDGGVLMANLAKGDPAPDFALPDHDGTPVSLGQFASRRVVVYFYPKDDTTGCTKEACQFNDLLAEFSKADVDILGISPDDADSHQAFRDKYSLNVRLLTDNDHAVMENYGAWGERVRDGKTSLGVLRSTFLVGPDGVLESVWYNVNPDGHPAEVLAALAE